MSSSLSNFLHWCWDQKEKLNVSFSKVFHGGTTCRNGGYAMDDNGKRIAWQTNELYANIVEIRWEALGHLVRIHPSIVWSFEVSPNGARGNRRLFSQGQATGPRRWQIFAQSTRRKLQKGKKIDQKNCGKDIRNISLWGGNQRLVSQGQATGPSSWAWLGRRHPPSSPRLTIDQHVYFPISIVPSIFMYRLLLMLM